MSKILFDPMLFFSAIGNAYSVLSDKEKRRKYDVYGPDLQQSSPTPDYTHGGFEGQSFLFFFNMKDGLDLGCSTAQF